MTLTINNFKKVMIAKAKSNGLTENFGQNEIEKLRAKYKYNPYDSTKERQIAAQIDGLNEWSMTFDLSQI